MRVTQAHAGGGVRRSPAATAGTMVAADADSTLSSCPDGSLEASSLADSKRLKHREYVKKSYNKKIVRPQPVVKNNLCMCACVYICTHMLRCETKNIYTEHD